MIEFHSQTNFELVDEAKKISWLQNIADTHNAIIESIGYVFCDDEFVYNMNLEHLQHDTYTDIITFDYGTDDLLEGEIYISVDRVRENAQEFQSLFDEELRRVMAHGLLHMMGYGDYSAEEKLKMRQLEDECLKMFHVKH